MTLLGQRVATCEGCGEDVLNTQPRVSAHGPLDYAKFIGGGEFDALLKQAGYSPNPDYGTGGTYSEPRLLHLWCAPKKIADPIYEERRKAGIVDPPRDG